MSFTDRSTEITAAHVNAEFMRPDRAPKELKDLLNYKGVPTCECGGNIKPDVVLYEEGLDNNVIQESVRFISEADVLIIGGTSLVVYPAAGLIDYYRGNKLVVINKQPTSRDKYADLCISGSIGEVLGSLKI